jgi:hypothetical protein
VHAVDWSNNELLALTNSATDAGVVRRGDVEHLRRLIAWLRGPGITGTTRLVLVDRLDALVREVREVDGGALAAELIDVISGGRTRGVYVAATVDVAGLVAGPLASLGGRRLVLSVDDPTMAAAIGIPRRTAPTVSGRGISVADGDEVQIGVPRSQSPVVGLPVPGYVGAMPTDVLLESLPKAIGERVVIGLGGNATIGPIAVDLDEIGPVVAVIGRARSGRSAALDVIAATYRGGRRVVRLNRASDATWDVAAEPTLVLVDDAVAVAANNPWLTSPDLVDELAAGGHVLVAVFDQAELNTLGFSHWLMRRPCPGLLLSLDATPDRMVAGERLGFHPPAELRVGPAGRGWWCDRSGATGVQVAR